jgi:HAMP domain-containing protein
MLTRPRSLAPFAPSRDKNGSREGREGGEGKVARGVKGRECGREHKSMRFPRLRKRYWLLAAVLLIIYCLSYFWVRRTGLLIHRVSYATHDNAGHYYHSISAGRYSGALAEFVYGCYIAFTPLRWVESWAWEVHIFKWSG